MSGVASIVGILQVMDKISAINLDLLNNTSVLTWDPKRNFKMVPN